MTEAKRLFTLDEEETKRSLIDVEEKYKNKIIWLTKRSLEPLYQRLYISSETKQQHEGYYDSITVN